MSFDLHGCETWSFILREQHRLRVFKNRVLRKIRVFGPQDKEVIGGWSKMHNEGLQDLKLSPNIIMVIKSRTVRWWACGTSG
jgi:hypothetical protein